MARKLVWIPLNCIIALMLIGQTATPTLPESALSGHVLIRALEFGVPDDGDHLFLADAANGRVAEMVVENESFFSPWFGWSPLGGSFAYLAPARRGEHFELWRADASIDFPNRRAPLLEINRNVVSARWQPDDDNILALATASNRERDGIYLLNAWTDVPVFIAEENFGRNSLLDWSNSGEWLAYTDASGALKMVNVASQSIVPLLNAPAQPFNFLPDYFTGWTENDLAYFVQDDVSGRVIGVRTDGSGQLIQLPPIFENTEKTIILPQTNQLLTVVDGEIYTYDVEHEVLTSVSIATQNQLAGDFAWLEGNQLLMNSFIPVGDDLFAECLLVNPIDGASFFLREILAVEAWTHTFCASIGGGTHIAILSLDEITPFDRLPDDVLYSLTIVPISLESATFISDSYPGFALAPLGFSARRQQVIFQEDSRLVVYHLNGERQEIAPLASLGITGDFVNLTYVWEP